MNFQVAIDGPAGAGKSSVCKLVSKECGLIYVDTGAMYRMCALTHLKKPSTPLEKITKDLTLTITHNNKFHINGVDVTNEIRTEMVTKNVSRVAQNKSIRDFVNKQSMQIANVSDVLMDGRDIGTVVLPNADVKVYLDATPEERAMRRLNQMKLPKSKFNEVLRSIQDRDFADSNREIAPLRKANDAFHLITDGLTKEEVVNKIVRMIANKKQL